MGLDKAENWDLLSIASNAKAQQGQTPGVNGPMMTDVISHISTKILADEHRKWDSLM
jgi:hypothetical protein